MRKRQLIIETTPRIKELKVSHTHNQFFPPFLRGKKLELILAKSDTDNIDMSTLQLFERRMKDAEGSLEKYLAKEDPEYLFKAAQNNIELFTNKFVNANSTREEYVSAQEIFWSSVEHWSFLVRYSLSKEFYGRAKRYLQKLGGLVFVPPQEKSATIFDSSGLAHRIVRMKGKKSSIFTNRPRVFVNYFQRIEGVFDSSLLPRYSGPREKKKHIKEIIQKKLGNNITDEQLKYFEIDQKRSITASYIAFRHAQDCPFCKKTPSYKTIKNIYESCND